MCAQFVLDRYGVQFSSAGVFVFQYVFPFSFLFSFFFLFFSSGGVTPVAAIPLRGVKSDAAFFFFSFFAGFFFSFFFLPFFFSS